MANSNIPPPNVPLIDERGYCNVAWYRYLANLDRTATGALAGEVQGTDGLAGGGLVSGGVNLSIADNGVTDVKIRQGAATSVIGRFSNSAGNVADITATADNRLLGREGGVLAFRSAPTVEGINVTDLRINTAPVVAAAVPSTHTVAVNINGAAARLLVAIP